MASPPPSPVPILAARIVWEIETGANPPKRTRSISGAETCPVTIPQRPDQQNKPGEIDECPPTAIPRAIEIAIKPAAFLLESHSDEPSRVTRGHRSAGPVEVERRMYRSNDQSSNFGTAKV